MGEGVDELTVGVLLEALQRHGPAGGIADELFQLIPPVRGDLGVGVQRKALDAGTVWTGELGRLAFRTKARADAAHVLAGPFAISDAVLDRSRHGPREFRYG